MVVTVPGNEGKDLAPGTLNALLMKADVVIEKTETGFSAYSPDVLGCVAVGDTEEETRQNFQDALRFHFDAMREVGEEVLEPHTPVDYVEVAA